MDVTECMATGITDSCHLKTSMCAPEAVEVCFKVENAALLADVLTSSTASFAIWKHDTTLLISLTPKESAHELAPRQSSL